MYFYTLGERYRDYVPHAWCFAYFCLTDYLPTIFHTASVWLTVALAAHRYVYVCHPGLAKRLCTMTNVLRLIAIIYFVAVVSQLWRFFEYQYIPVDVLSEPGLQGEMTIAENGEFGDVGEADGGGEQGEVSQLVVNFTTSSTIVDDPACYYVLSPGVSRHESVLFNTYYWFRVVCVHIVPCTSLVVLNSALVGAIRTAQHCRSELLHRRSHRARTTSDGGGTRLLNPADCNNQQQASTSGATESTRRPQGGSIRARTRRLPHLFLAPAMIVV